MNINHRLGSILFGVVAGLAIATWSYYWITDPQKLEQRQREERAVLHARDLLAARLSIRELQIVDPLATNRKVGKVYVYPTGDGWDVSGYYRRDERDRWHAYLLSMSSGLELKALRVDDADPSLGALAASDPLLDVAARGSPD